MESEIFTFVLGKTTLQLMLTSFDISLRPDQYVYTNMSGQNNTALTHGDPGPALDEMGTQIPPKQSPELWDPIPPGEVVHLEAGGYSLVVKMFGDKNLVWGNVEKAIAEVRKALLGDNGQGGVLQTTKFFIQDIVERPEHLEGIVGFYDTETLRALQQCPP